MNRIIPCRKRMAVALVFTGNHHFLAYSRVAISQGMLQAFKEGHITKDELFAMAPSAGMLKKKFIEFTPPTLPKFPSLHADIREQLSEEEFRRFLPGVLIAEECGGKRNVN